LLFTGGNFRRYDFAKLFYLQPVNNYFVPVQLIIMT